MTRDPRTAPRDRPIASSDRSNASRNRQTLPRDRATAAAAEYAVTVSREFVARHYLIVPNSGPEGELHAHRYAVAVTLSGPSLDEHGYLVDIDDVRAALSGAVARYRDETLNDLPEFDGHNPSAERLARALHDRLFDHLDPGAVERVRVTVWEDDDAAATYEAPV